METQTSNVDQLKAVEHLLSQSLKGFHFAFEKEDIKLALGAPLNGISDFEYEDRDKVLKVFTEFVNKKNLTEQQSFLQNLEAEDRELLIKAYFNILENTLKKCVPMMH